MLKFLHDSLTSTALNLLSTVALVTVVIPGIALAQMAPSEQREEDDEPNQQAVLETIGTESERSQWLLEGAELVLKPRTYYLHRSYDVADTRAGWALGGGLEFRSGWWEDRIRFGATLSTSQKLYGPSDKDGTQLFKPGPESFTVVSEAYATIRLAGDHGVRIGRQTLDLPYLGKHDLRMIPNTFEAVGIGNKPGDGFAYMAGYVDSIKYKDSDEFIPMSEAAGIAGSDDGLTFVGARYRLPNQSVYGVLHQRTPDLFETTFAKVEQPRSQRNSVILWCFWSKAFHRFLKPCLRVILACQQLPTAVPDLVACTTFNGVGVCINGCAGFSFGSMHITDEGPSFVTSIIESNAVLCCTQRMVFQIQSVHGRGCGDPCFDVLRSVRPQAVAEQTNGCFRMPCF